MSLVSLIYAYLLGGITFIPFLVIAFIYLHPVKDDTKDTSLNDENEPIKAGEIEENASSGLDTYKQGWIIVTTEYHESPEHINSSSQSVADSQEGKSAYSSLYKLVRNSSTKSKESGIKDKDKDSREADDEAMAAPTSTKNKKHRYYGVLKHGNLFLYKNESLKDVKHVVVLSHLVVLTWPRDLMESQLFSKYSSIAILKKDWNRKRRLSENKTGSADSQFTVQDVADSKSHLPPPPGSFFIYTDCNIDKEDWYFALIRASKTDSNNIARNLDPAYQAKTLHFETRNMVELIQRLYSSEGQLHTKWFNAIVGRLFLSLQQTDQMKNYLVAKIEKKLNKMKTPGFLDKFQITKVDAGTGAPFVSFPSLREINPEGDLLVAFHLHYHGNIAVQLATKVNINLGSRFKTREMDVLLLIKLEKLLGPMLLRIKPPPSARMWYTFEQQPSMGINIEPIISSRQMSYNIITNSIEKKLKDAVRTSLVLPHWDDFVFCNTELELYRGGIWDKSVRPDEPDEPLENEYSDEYLTRAERISKNSSNEEHENLEHQDGSDRLETPDGTQLRERSDKSVHNEIPEGEQNINEDNMLAISSTGYSNHSAHAPEDEDSVSVRAELSDEPAPSNKLSKMRFTSTITDISRRLRKGKSTHTIGVDGSNCLSDGSIFEKPSMENLRNDDFRKQEEVGSQEESSLRSSAPELSAHGSSPLREYKSGDESPKESLMEQNSTLRKIGNWYFKDGNLQRPPPAPMSSSFTKPSSPKSTYNPPEMISNRRPRKPSSASYLNDAIKMAADSNGKSFSYDFGSEVPEDLLKGLPNPPSVTHKEAGLEALPILDNVGTLVDSKELEEKQHVKQQEPLQPALSDLRPTRAKTLHRKPPPAVMEEGLTKHSSNKQEKD